MNSRCPTCSAPASFWAKLNSSRFKPYVCAGCGNKWQVAHFWIGIAASICVPVFIRYLLEQRGVALPQMVQFLLPVPLIYVIFKFLLPLQPAKPDPFEQR